MILVLTVEAMCLVERKETRERTRGPSPSGEVVQGDFPRAMIPGLKLDGPARWASDRSEIGPGSKMFRLDFELYNKTYSIFGLGSSILLARPESGLEIAYPKHDLSPRLLKAVLFCFKMFPASSSFFQ